MHLHAHAAKFSIRNPPDSLRAVGAATETAALQVRNKQRVDVLDADSKARTFSCDAGNYQDRTPASQGNFVLEFGSDLPDMQRS